MVEYFVLKIILSRRRKDSSSKWTWYKKSALLEWNRADFHQ